jgi:uncharacterized protein YijF (DUF1287 family)
LLLALASVGPLAGPAANIDHRRVPNLQAFLSRQGRVLPASMNADD